MKPSAARPALCTALAACGTTPTVYGPAASAQGVGFSEYRIEPGRYRITFRGGPGAPVEQVSDYALLRAADLAIAEGYDWFRVADRYTTQERGQQRTAGLDRRGRRGPAPFRQRRPGRSAPASTSAAALR